MPALSPETRPVLSIVATIVFDDTQAFEAAAVALPVNWVVEPAQTLNVPVIAGKAFTTTLAVI